MKPDQTIPDCSLSSLMRHNNCRLAKKIININSIRASLILMLFMLYPVCGFAEDKADAPQAVESQTANSGQATDETVQKKETKKDQTLEPIVVTATRTPQSLSDVPAAVSVVTSEDIESRNIQRVDQAVNALPGVFDFSQAQLDQLGFIEIRGLQGFQRNLVLLDGEPLNQAFAGVVNWNSLNPLDVARIEVVRGPFSSLYGGNAEGGVINIITKTPQEREITVQSGYGSYNTWNEYASYGDKLCNRLSVLASFGYTQSDGYPNIPVVAFPAGYLGGSAIPVHGAIPTTTTSGFPGYIIGNSGDYNWWTQSASLKLVYDLDPDSKATFSYRNNQYGFGYGSPQSFLRDSSGNTIFSNAGVNGVPISVNGIWPLSASDWVANNDKGTYMENIFHGDYQTKLFGDAALKISAGFIDTPNNHYDEPSPNGPSNSFYGPGLIYATSSEMFNTDVQLSLPLCEKHLLTFGAAFRYDEADQPVTNLTNWQESGTQTNLYSDSRGKDTIYSLYTQAEIALLRNLTLYAGVRGDYWTTFDGFTEQVAQPSVGVPGFATQNGSESEFKADPKGSLVYKPWDGTTFRTSVGTAFRPPTVYELYTTWIASGFGFLANPKLNPETTFAWDIGVEQKLGSSTVCKLNYFNNHIDNYIYGNFVGTTPSGIYLYQNINAGRAETDGVEFEIENKPMDCLKLFANTTYTHSEMLSNSVDPMSVGKQLQYVPDWMFNVGGEVTYRKFTFTLTGRYVDKQFGNADNTDKVSGVFGSYDSYFVLNSKIQYKLTDRATLFFSVNNMLDEKYFTYYQAPGVQFFGGVTAKF